LDTFERTSWVLLTFKTHWIGPTAAIGDVESELAAMKPSTIRWLHTSFFHAGIIGTSAIQKAESAAG